MRRSLAIASTAALLAACSSAAPPPSAATAAAPGATTAAPAQGGHGAAGGSTGPAPRAGTPATATAGAAADGGRRAEPGDDAGLPPSAGASPPPGTPATGTFPPVSDYNADGPFKAGTLENTGPNNNYTVYLPDTLAPGGAKNPIVGWMSGGGTVPSAYPLLPRLATHGFVVVASNTAPGIGDEVNLGQEILAGISWAIAENSRDGSQFQGKLDTTKIASVGYSMGSLATFTIANDPRLTTTVHISGGNMAPERIDNLRMPAEFLCGIPGDDSCNILSNDCDIAAANCDTDFNNAKTPVFYANFQGGHLGILTPPLQDQIQTEVVAWLRWQLMSDSTLKARFVGDDCQVCKDSRWKVKQKNLM